MNAGSQVEKTDAPANAIGKILSFIRERRYRPTERLPSERDFAEKFDTSRSAVREALAALEAMRVIERRPNSGIYLRNTDDSSVEALVLQAESGLQIQADELADAMEVRRMLEAQAARLAAVLCATAEPSSVSHALPNGERPGQSGVGLLVLYRGFSKVNSVSVLAYSPFSQLDRSGM